MFVCGGIVELTFKNVKRLRCPPYCASSETGLAPFFVSSVLILMSEIVGPAGVPGNIGKV